MPLRLLLGLLLLPALLHAASAQVVPQPVPRMQVIPLPRHEASIQDDGREIARYVFDPALHRPFVFPLIGPSGRSLTRMGHPRDPNGHSHHNSVWISHHDVAGVDFWGDAGKGRIVQTRIARFEDAEGEALIAVDNVWRGLEDKVLLKEKRTLRFQPLADRELLLLIDLEFSTPDKTPVTLGKTPFGLIGVRMAKTIGVLDGGGAIRNSAGADGEKEIFWQRAKWVDYSGPITREASEGITLMDHPSNPSHPSHFHVRGDGWMGASLTLEEARTIEPEKPLHLCYGLYVHSGVYDRAKFDALFAEFAKVLPPPKPEKK